MKRGKWGDPRQTLQSLGLGSSVAVKKAGNPYLGFLVDAAPWILIAGIIAAAIYVLTRKKAAGRARTQIK